MDELREAINKLPDGEIFTYRSPTPMQEQNGVEGYWSAFIEAEDLKKLVKQRDDLLAAAKVVRTIRYKGATETELAEAIKAIDIVVTSVEAAIRSCE